MHERRRSWEIKSVLSKQGPVVSCGIQSPTQVGRTKEASRCLACLSLILQFAELLAREQLTPTYAAMQAAATRNRRPLLRGRIDDRGNTTQRVPAVAYRHVAQPVFVHPAASAARHAQGRRSFITQFISPEIETRHAVEMDVRAASPGFASDEQPREDRHGDRLRSRAFSAPCIG